MVLAFALRFLLKDGQLWLCEPQAKLVSTPIILCKAVIVIEPMVNDK